MGLCPGLEATLLTMGGYERLGGCIKPNDIGNPYSILMLQ